MENPHIDESIEMKCMFDYREYCIGYIIHGQQFYQPDYSETDVHGYGLYNIPNNVNPIGRTAQSLLIYAKRVK